MCCSRQQAFDEHLGLASPRPRIDPAQKPAELDKADAVLAREIGVGESSGGAHRQIKGREGRRTGIRERIEKQHDIRVTLFMKACDVQLLVSQRGAPIDVAGAVAGNERADVAWLDPLAQSRRDVVAERELGPRRSRQVSNRLDIRVYRDRLWLRLERFVHGQPRATTKSRVYGAETESAGRSDIQNTPPNRCVCQSERQTTAQCQ